MIRRAVAMPALLCAVLAALPLALVLGAAPEPVAPPPGPPAVMPAPPRPTAPPRLDAFAEVVQRPLFAPSRRPPKAMPVAAEPAAPEPRMPDLVLLGVVATGSDRLALVQQAGAGKILMLRPGDQVAGAVIDSIAEDRLALRLGARSLDVVLREPRGQKGPSPRPAAAQPTRPKPPGR